MFMQTPLIYVSGIYRSGTTLLSRLLNAEEKIASASDPIRPFFNAYRSKLESLTSGKHNNDTFRPLDDYYKGNGAYLEKLLIANFSEKLEQETQDLLRKTIPQATLPYSNKFAEAIKNTKHAKSNTWKEELDLYLSTIHSVYSKGDTKFISFKEVWAIEMALPLFNTYGKNMNLVSIIRDPRSILASSKRASGNYPIIYLSRQWRKHVIFTYFLKQLFPENTFIIHYEDLCKSPKETYVRTFSEIMRKVGGNILDIPNARDEEGYLWKQNSSFFSENVGVVGTNSLNSWQEELTDDEIEWTNFLTYQCFEKKYSQSTSYPKSPYPVRDPEQVSGWMTALLDLYEDERRLNNILQDEKIRLMNCKPVETINISNLINHY